MAVFFHFFIFSFWEMLKNIKKRGKKILFLSENQLHMSFSFAQELEPRQYKNDSNLSKNNSNFEFGALFHHLHRKGISAPISKLELSLTELSRSYSVFALVRKTRKTWINLLDLNECVIVLTNKCFS